MNQLAMFNTLKQIYLKIVVISFGVFVLWQILSIFFDFNLAIDKIMHIPFLIFSSFILLLLISLIFEWFKRKFIKKDKFEVIPEKSRFQKILDDSYNNDKEIDFDIFDEDELAD